MADRKLVKTFTEGARVAKVYQAVEESGPDWFVTEYFEADEPAGLTPWSTREQADEDGEKWVDAEPEQAL